MIKVYGISTISINIIISAIFFIKIQLIFCHKCNNVYTLEDSECFNNILYIHNSSYRAGQFAKNKKGDLFIEYSTANQRLFYGLKKDGNFYFNSESHYKERNITGIYYKDFLYEGRYESKNIFVSSKDDINKNKEYLLSLGSYKTLIELYDIENDLIFTDITEKVFDEGIFSFHFPLFGTTKENQNTYIIIYTHDNGSNIYHEGYLFSIKKFSFKENEEGHIETEIIKSSEKYLVKDSRMISGFLGENDFIYVIYLTTENKIYFRKYDYTNLEIKDSYIITEDIMDKEVFGIFKTGVFKSLYLKNNKAA